MLHGPNDVLRTERGVTAEIDSRQRRFESRGIDDRCIPLIELDPDIAFYPWKRILLANRENDVVAGDEDLVDDCAFENVSFRTNVVLDTVKQHPLQLAAVDDEFFWRVINDDLDPLLFGVLELPIGGLEESARLAGHNLDVRCA